MKPPCHTPFHPPLKKLTRSPQNHLNTSHGILIHHPMSYVAPLTLMNQYKSSPKPTETNRIHKIYRNIYKEV